MNDLELVAAIDTLVKRETEITLELLIHLGEFERREAFRGLGYHSLYDYCTRHLKYAESAAHRRVKAARCIRDFPAVFEMLRAREVNLTTICHFASVLTQDNQGEVLSAVRGKSKEQVKQYVESFSPKKSVPREVIRVVQVKPVEASPAPLFVAPAFVVETTPTPIVETKKVIQITVSLTEEEYAEVCRLQTIRSRSGRVPKTKDLFVAGVAELLKKEDPKQRMERRQRRAEKIETTSPEKFESGMTTRHIPSQTADKVLNKSDLCCSFTANGVKCTNKVGIQIDHIQPYGMGGGHDESNLRTLCRVHNQFVAEEAYGKAVMDQYRSKHCSNATY